MQGIAGLPKLEEKNRIVLRLFKARGSGFYFWEAPVMEVLIECL
jgi:hypothetical protein